MLQSKTVEIIWEQDFSELVSKTYGRPFRLQQQELLGQDEIRNLTIGSNCEEALDEDHEEWEDHPTFQEWLDRDPKEKFDPDESDFGTEITWERDFYPPLGEVLKDLLAKGLVKEGEYVLHVWW